MGFFSNLVDSVKDIGGDVFDSVSETASDAYDSVAESASDAYDSVAETADEAYESAAATARDYYNQAATAAQDVYDRAVSGAEELYDEAEAAVIEAAESYVRDAADWFAGVADEYVFDTVDYVTGGVVNLDYDDGGFRAQIGIDGVAEAGLAYSEEEGFSASGQVRTGVVDADFSYDDGSFSGQFSAGIDYGPLPYAEGHLEIDDNGEISVGGRVQGSIPTQAGLLQGGLSGEYVRHEDGSWGASGSAEGTLYTPSGTVISGGVHGAYAEDADGDTEWSAGGRVGVGFAGGGTVGAGVEYSETEIDGVETQDVSGYVEGGYGGASGRLEGEYQRVEDAAGNVTEDWDGRAEVSAYGTEVSTDDVAEWLGDELAEFSGSNANTPEAILDDVVSDAWRNLGTTDQPFNDGFYNEDAYSMDRLPPDVAAIVLDGAEPEYTAEPAAESAPPADDFSADIASAESFESSADEVWDDIES